MGFFVLVGNVNKKEGFCKIRSKMGFSMETGLPVEITREAQEIYNQSIIESFYNGDMKSQNIIIQDLTIPVNKVKVFLDVKPTLITKAKEKAKEIVRNATWGDDY